MGSTGFYFGIARSCKQCNRVILVARRAAAGLVKGFRVMCGNVKEASGCYIIFFESARLFWCTAVGSRNGTGHCCKRLETCRRASHLQHHIPEQLGQDGSKRNMMFLCAPGMSIFHSRGRAGDISRLQDRMWWVSHRKS